METSNLKIMFDELGFNKFECVNMIVGRGAYKKIMAYWKVRKMIKRLKSFS